LVSRSIVWSNCWVGAKAVVDDTFLADHCIVEPGHQLFGAVHIAPANRPVAAPAPDIATEAAENATTTDRRFWSSLGLVASIGLRREHASV
jgi:NDP-sugar pyrophosphorylase family protein